MEFQNENPVATLNPISADTQFIHVIGHQQHLVGETRNM